METKSLGKNYPGTMCIGANCPGLNVLAPLYNYIVSVCLPDFFIFRKILDTLVVYIHASRV